MKTLFKVVYRQPGWDEVNDKERDFITSEFYDNAADAQARYDMWAKNGQAVGKRPFLANFDEKWLEEVETYTRRMRMTGEFGFEARRRIKRECKNAMMPVVHTKENDREWRNKADYIASTVHA